MANKKKDAQNSRLTDEEIAFVAEKLAKLAPGRLPRPIFNEVARLKPLAVVELIVVNERGKVLLTQRPSDDPFWPNKWHIPGVALSALDESVDSALERLVHDELEGMAIATPVLTKNAYLRQSERGTEFASIYHSRLLGGQAVGSFFDVSNLPLNIVGVNADLLTEKSVAKKFTA